MWPELTVRALREVFGALAAALGDSEGVGF